MASTAVRVQQRLFSVVLHLLLLLRQGGAFVGVNIGRRDENSEMPPAAKIVDLLRQNKITHVRLLNADPQILNSLSRTGIQVVVGVAISDLDAISDSPATAADWVKKNIVPFAPATNITSIAVACNLFSGDSDHLLPAMNHLHGALTAANLQYSIKISTPTPIDLIPKPFPPSDATFNSTIASTISQLLQFLANTQSPFMLNAYPYNGYIHANGIFPLAYALSRPLLSSTNQIVVDPNTLLQYTSMLDAMVDAAYYSMSALNFSTVPVLVTETGWPWAWAREDDEPDATVMNSAAFRSNLFRRLEHVGSGPPSRPWVGMDVYIYEMFSHGRRNGSEKLSWGVFFPNGTGVYARSSFNGSSSSSSSGGREGAVGFCVAKEGAEEEKLREGIRWACGNGMADCEAIQKGEACFLPDTPIDHASYAYNQYYQKRREEGGTCDFSGTAEITSVDPSRGSCMYAGSGRVSKSRGGNRTSDRVESVASATMDCGRRVRGVSLLFLVFTCACFFGFT